MYLWIFLRNPTIFEWWSHHFCQMCNRRLCFENFGITISGLDTQQKFTIFNVYCFIITQYLLFKLIMSWIFPGSFADEISICGPFPWLKVTDPIIEAVIVPLRKLGINLLRVCGDKYRLRRGDTESLKCQTG